MDAGTLIYIVLVIIYFLFTAFKKKNKPQEGEERFEGEEEGERRPASFEDMLREIRREQEQRTREVENREQPEEEDLYEEAAYSQPTPAPKPKPKPQPKAQNEPANPYKKYYEGGEGSLKNVEKEPLVTLDEQVDISSDEKIIGEVEDVAEEKSAVNPYAKLLKNPETVKDAVVLSEILNRKYF
ncbi:hypothetical protein KIH41_04195 [Litoribacter ruber]|uniref:hypothetical protein n=1 Tax=Litoribacter ruber TaxID=702568 RepID=UPI001BDB40BD|nr:hypothetical protein [Litoribacter ruber]MBT0810476.1 hypothetical protein [Litoribacter ruber]